MSSFSLSDLLAIRIFHSDADVREKAYTAFSELADRQLRAFVERQLAQNYKADEFYDVQALVAALIRNPSLDAATLVKAAMDLKGAGTSLILLAPESERPNLLQNSLKDGQLNLAGIGPATNSWMNCANTPTQPIWAMRWLPKPWG